MDAADAARLTEAVTDAVADAVKRGENYSSLEDFLTDESVGFFRKNHRKYVNLREDKDK